MIVNELKHDQLKGWQYCISNILSNYCEVDYLDELVGYNCEVYFLGVELSLQALKQSYTILHEKC